jgi:isopentenyl phosphate kinase
MDLLLLKLGGSLLTEKAGVEALRPDVLARLAGEIAAFTREEPGRLVVGHGSGSFGHVAAHRYRLAGGLREPDQLPGVSLTQDRAATLHRHVVAALEAAGALPFSIAPSSCVVAHDGAPVALFAEPLLLALDRGLLPVLYGDVVLDRSRGVAIGSTESLFTLLAHRLPEHGRRIARAVWLGETDGVYDRDGSTLPHLSAGSFAESSSAIGAAAGTDVTGGMRHRVETALDLARLGIPSRIANGLTPGLLGRALRGEPVAGTAVA